MDRVSLKSLAVEVDEDRSGYSDSVSGQAHRGNHLQYQAERANKLRDLEMRAITLDIVK